MPLTHPLLKFRTQAQECMNIAYSHSQIAGRCTVYGLT
uniref:Uncharacterized protein n=1 Tax=Anguilla anguilla TaxID=7936 RepID=A0A0E9W545_ANGAN